MPRLVHRTPKYRHHAGSGQALVTINGKDIYLGKYKSSASRREYKRIISEWRTNNRALPPSAQNNGYSMAELIAAFWGHAETYYAVTDGKSGGELASIKLMLRVVKNLYADTDVIDFGPLALSTVQQAMMKKDWSRKYINAQVNRVRRMFKWGVRHELVSADTWQALITVEPLRVGKSDARENDPVTCVPNEHVEAVLPWLNRHVRAMLELQRITGMRPGEVCVLRRCV